MDIQLQHKNKPLAYIFIEERISVKNTLYFLAETVKFNEKTQENEKVKFENIPASEFSKWWMEYEKDGWEICE
jgi:hypothetical protein